MVKVVLNELRGCHAECEAAEDQKSVLELELAALMVCNEMDNGQGLQAAEKAIQSNDEQEIMNFLNDVEAKGSKVYSVDETTDAGLRVTGLGGIISILRFAVEAS